MVLWSQDSISLTVSEIFNGQCDAMVDMTSNDQTMVVHFGTNRFLIYDFLYRLSIVTFALGHAV